MRTEINVKNYAKKYVKKVCNCTNNRLYDTMNKD